MILRRANGSSNATTRVNAMMQEIASWTVTSAEYVRSSGGWESYAAYIAAVEQGRQRRSFFMVRNDTHGLAYTESRPYPETQKTEYVIQGGNKNNGKPGNDQNSPEGL